jgi:hypothetical protein
MMVTGGGGVANRVVGAVLAGLGGLALWEGWRLYTLRTTLVAGAVVGDDTFPMLVGAALIPLGAWALAGRLPAPSAASVDSPVRAQMLRGAVLLAAYWAVMPYLGYTEATALASIGLYRALGGYRWTAALLLGAVTTGALHLVFRVWLLQPLPGGLLGS